MQILIHVHVLRNVLKVHMLLIPLKGASLNVHQISMLIKN